MGGGGGGGGYSNLSLKVLLGAVATVVFVLLLLVGALESTGGATSEMTTKLTSIDEATQNDHDQVIIGRDELVYNSELDLSYMTSKRRVPNGPDPIHNRRAGNSKRPPGRA